MRCEIKHGGLERIEINVDADKNVIMDVVKL